MLSPTLNRSVTAVLSTCVYLLIFSASINGQFPASKPPKSPALNALERSSRSRKILVLYWYNKDFPGNVAFDQSFQAALRSASGGPFEYYPEYLETDRFPGENQSLLFRDYLSRKYARVDIDVIVASGFVPQSFLLKYRDTVLPRTPIVFVTVERPTPEQLSAHAGETGILLYKTFNQTLTLALRLHPETEQVFVVSGNLEHDKAFERLAQEDLKGYESRVQINYLTDLTPEELIDKTKNLPSRSVVLYAWQQSQNELGKVIESADILTLLARTTKAPIYGLSGANVGSGVIGGYVFTVEANAARAAAMAVAIANGARVQDLPLENAATVPTFDWRELQRWGISEDKLPLGSVLRFKELTFWQQFKGRILGASAIIILQFLLIAGLLLERYRRSSAARGLKDSEERNRAMLAAIPDLIFLQSKDGVFLDCHTKDPRALIVPPEQFIGKNMSEVLPSELSRMFRDVFKRALDTGETQICEYDLDLAVGRRWFETRIAPCNGSKLLSVVRDITERKQAEEALIASEEFNRLIVESSTDCIKLLDLEGNLLYMSPNGQRMLEINDIECYLHHSWSEMWGELKGLVSDAVQQARLGGIGAFQGFCPTAQGNPKWWDVVIAPIRNSHGRIERLLAVSRNITEHRQAMKAAQESEERFVKAFKANPQPMTVTTLAEGRYLDVNESFLRMSGYTRDEVIGHTSIELGNYEHPGDRQTVLVNPLLSSGCVRNFELRFRSKSGAFRTLLSSAELLELSGERCILVASSDITERKRLEEELKRSKGELATLVENSPDLISRLDQDLRYTYVSPALVRISSLAAEQFIGRTPREMGFDWKGYEESCRQAFSTGQTLAQEFVYKDRTYHNRIIPEFSAHRKIDFVMTISEDVTERLRTQQELLKLTARLFNLQDEERRRMARELHDGAAQNLFGVTINLANLDRALPGKSPEARRLLTECQVLSEETLQELRTLSYLLHPPMLDQAGLALALRCYVEGFAKRSGIGVDLIAIEDIGRLPSEIELALFRIVQESLTNVRRHSGSKTASIRLEKKPGKVVLAISDHGTGLARDGEYFTGKEAPEIGVGIPGMQQRLIQLGGRLEIESSDHGTKIVAIVPDANGTRHGDYLTS